MARTLRLRRWQKRALDQFQSSGHADFLAVATPGAGKTTLSLTAAVQHLHTSPRSPVIVVTPTQHLRTQWADSAASLGLALEPSWSSSDGALPSDVHGAVLTYQQVASAPAKVAAIARDGFVVLDEVHHAGAEKAWGDSVAFAFANSARRLSVSGTPFRSDTQAIPFVRYADDEAVADFTYGYSDALRDGGVVRPVHFPRLDGQMEWRGADGLMRSHTFADHLTGSQRGQRLRTALSLGGEWLPTVLTRAHQQLTEIRQTHRDAGGLVIAIDHEHARGIADLMARRLRVQPVVATSDDPNASDHIAKFANSNAPWIVAVRMVSEGVDIPRLRVGVFATNTTTELFFRQAVGRLVRWRPELGEDQASYMFIPDDIRLRTFATEIGRERRHSLRKPDARPEEEDEHFFAKDPWEHREEKVAEDFEQESLFAAISAVALGEEIQAVDLPRAQARVDDDPDLVLQLVAPPTPVGANATTTNGDTPIVHHRSRAVLRTRNSDIVRDLVARTGMSHASVNAQLNREAGVKKINEATIDQLQRRLDAAQKWRTKLTR